MVLISSLYLFQDARSWPDKVHDAWMLLGLALAGPWPGPWLALGLALAGPWPGPWLALGLALGWPLAWPSAGLVQIGSGSDRFGSSGSGSIRSHPDKNI